MNSEAVAWLEEHWNRQELPNNQWVVVGRNGLIAASISFEELFEEISLTNDSLNTIVFCYVTYDIWQ